MTGNSHEARPPARKRPEPIGMRVKRVQVPDGVGTTLAYFPASASDAERLRPANHRDGDLVFVQLRKPRNPGYHRMAHALAKLVVQNVDEFEGMPIHAALKRLQLESGAACEEMEVDMSSLWPRVTAWIGENMGESWATVLTSSLKAMGVKSRKVVVRIPQSLSYDSLDQVAFVEAIRQISRYVIKRYWPTMTESELEKQLVELTSDILKD